MVVYGDAESVPLREELTKETLNSKLSSVARECLVPVIVQDPIHAEEGI